MGILYRNYGALIMDGLMDALQQAAFQSLMIVILMLSLVSILVVYCFHNDEEND